MFQPHYPLHMVLIPLRILVVVNEEFRPRRPLMCFRLDDTQRHDYSQPAPKLHSRTHEIYTNRCGFRKRVLVKGNGEEGREVRTIMTR